MRENPNVVLLGISLKAKDIECFFPLYVLALCVSSCGNRSAHLIRLFVPSMLNILSSLNIVGVNHIYTQNLLFVQLTEPNKMI